MARIAVVGAGFVGLSSAYWLMRDGQQVSLYEPRGAAGGASFGNAGTFANYACIPLNNPSVFRDLPRYLFASQSP
jgi:D-amino-acid dehydrogenase